MFNQIVRVILMCLAAVSLCGCKRSAPTTPARESNSQGASEQFIALMNSGRNAFVQGNITNALVAYKKAATIAPRDLDLSLNLANCYLASGQNEDALRETDAALKIDNNSA